MAKKNVALVPDVEVTPIAVSVGSLGEIVAAGEAGMYTSKDVHEPLLAVGYVEINPNIVDADGNIATRATATGVKAHKATAEVQVFDIEADIPLPEPKKRGRQAGSQGPRAPRGSKYPFDTLEIGQSFFVGTTAEADAVKVMQSATNSANRKFSMSAIPQVWRTIESPVYLLDGNGQRVIDEVTKKPIVIETKTRTVEVRMPLRRFVVRPDTKVLADGTTLEGARVFRVPLE